MFRKGKNTFLLLCKPQGELMILAVAIYTAELCT